MLTPVFDPIFAPMFTRTTNALLDELLPAGVREVKLASQITTSKHPRFRRGYSPDSQCPTLEINMTDNVPNFHDAVLKGVEIVTATATVVRVFLSYLPSESERIREDRTIEFKNVSSISSSIDFERLFTHSRFGNVSDWSPASGRGVTHFYLAEGMISIIGDPPVISTDSPHR